MRGLKMAALMATVPLAGCAGILELDFDLDGVEIRGSGYEATEVRFQRGFDEIEVHGVGRVIITVGPADGVEVTADDNILPRLESRVIGDRLVLSPESGVSLRPVHEIVYRVTVRNLRRMSVSGAVLVDIYDLDTGAFRADMSGAGRMVVDGIADRVDLSLSGASSFDALDLRTFETFVHASGAARAMVWVQEYLEVHGSGAADIRYRGRPEIYANVSGAARVSPY